MSEAIKGDPAVDQEAIGLTGRIGDRATYEWTKNLGAKTARRLGEACARMAIACDTRYKIALEQGGILETSDDGQ